MSDSSRPHKKVLINPNFCASKVHFNPHFVNNSAASWSGSSREHAAAHHAQSSRGLNNYSKTCDSAVSLKSRSFGEPVHHKYSAVFTEVQRPNIIPPMFHQPSSASELSTYTLVSTNCLAGQKCSFVTDIGGVGSDKTSCIHPMVHSAIASVSSSGSHQSSRSNYAKDQAEVQSTHGALPQWNCKCSIDASSHDANDACEVHSFASKEANSTRLQYSASENVLKSSTSSVSWHSDQSCPQISSLGLNDGSTAGDSDSHSYYVNPKFFSRTPCPNQYSSHSNPLLSVSKPEVTTVGFRNTSTIALLNNSGNKVPVINNDDLQNSGNRKEISSSPCKQTSSNSTSMPPIRKKQIISKVLLNPKFYNPQKIERTDLFLQKTTATLRYGPSECCRNEKIVSNVSSIYLPKNSISRTHSVMESFCAVSKLDDSIAIHSSKEVIPTSNKVRNVDHSVHKIQSSPFKLVKDLSQAKEKSLNQIEKNELYALTSGCKVNALHNCKAGMHHLSRTKLVRKNSSFSVSATKSSPKSTKLYYSSARKLICLNNASVKYKFPSASKITSTFKYKNKLVVKSPDWRRTHLLNSLVDRKRISPPAHKYSTLSARKLVRRLSADASTAVRQEQNTSDAHYKAVSTLQPGLHRNNANNKTKSDRFVKIGCSMYKTTPTSLKRQTAKLNNRNVISGVVSNHGMDSQVFHNHSHSLLSRASKYGQHLNMSSLSANKKIQHSCLHNYRSKSHINPHGYNHSAYVGRSAQQMLRMRKMNHHVNAGKFSLSLKSSAGCMLGPSLRSTSAKFSSGCQKEHQRILAAHALKAQALQHLIVAAKRRSVLALQRHAVALRKNMPTSSSSAAMLNAMDTTKVAPGVPRTTAAKPQKSGMYCRFYHRFGKCFRGDACPYEHNPDRVAICTRFLRGRCRVERCLFAHTLDKGRMPVCSHFLKGGLCVRDNCPYLHVNPNKNAPICEDFLHGHCDKREECKLQHVLECAEYRETGRCPRVACPLPHPRHRRAPGSAKHKKRKRRRSSLANSDGTRSVLGALPMLPTNAKKKKVQENVRYFEKNLFNNAAQSKQLEEKRRRVTKLVEDLKSRAKEASLKTTKAEKKEVVPKPQTIATGKYKLADEREVVFVQPLFNFSVEDKPLAFIPLSSDPGVSGSSASIMCSS